MNSIQRPEVNQPAANSELGSFCCPITRFWKSIEPEIVPHDMRARDESTTEETQVGVLPRQVLVNFSALFRLLRVPVIGNRILRAQVGDDCRAVVFYCIV